MNRGHREAKNTPFLATLHLVTDERQGVLLAAKLYSQLWVCRSPTALESNSACEMGTYGPQAASLQEHPHSPTCSAVLKPKPEPLSLSKPEAQQQSLQIDCRAEHSQPGYYHTFPADQISSRDQRAAGMLQEDASRESRGDTAQEPTCSHDSSRLQECQSPLSTQSHDKVSPVLTVPFLMLCLLNTEIWEPHF